MHETTTNDTTSKLLAQGLTFALALILVLGALPALSSAVAEEPGPAELALERFKALEGEWVGTGGDGKEVTFRYRVVGDGTAVLEESQVGGHHDMVTVYHLDGDRLMLTHYCAAGNQPRMRSAGLDGDRVRFDFVDVTGLGSSSDGHMHHAVFRFAGPDRLWTAWTWRENGEDAFTEEIEVERVASATASR
jgi:hypothetical protein